MNRLEKEGIEFERPPELKPDKNGNLTGGCLKFCLDGRGSSEDNAEDNAVVSRMRKMGWDVKSSADKMSWEWTISMEKFQANLDKQHADARRNANPRVTSVQEDADGIWDETGDYLTQEPVTLDKMLEPQNH